MTNFSATVVTSEAGDALHAAWVPGPSRRLLLGVVAGNDIGRATFVSPEQARELEAALRGARSLDLPEIKLRRANRGEPFREGFEFEVIDRSQTAQYGLQHSIFLEPHAISELTYFLSRKDLC